MNIDVRCRKCGKEFTTNPKVGTMGIVKCPDGHATVVREATTEEATALSAFMDLVNEGLKNTKLKSPEEIMTMQDALDNGYSINPVILGEEHGIQFEEDSSVRLPSDSSEEDSATAKQLHEARDFIMSSECECETSLPVNDIPENRQCWRCGFLSRYPEA